MIRLMNLMKWDIQLQLKYGFYIAAMVITALWSLLLSQLSGENLPLFLIFILFTDLTILGFYFIAGLIFFERSQGTLAGLVITPMKIWEYLVSKMISLTIIALLVSFAVIGITYGLKLQYIYLIPGIMLTSFFFILVGFIAIAKQSAIDQYLIISGAYFIILNLPLIDYFELWSHWIFYLIPTQASLLLLKAGFKGISTGDLIYSLVYLILAVGVFYYLAHRSFYKDIIVKEGGKSS